MKILLLSCFVCPLFCFSQARLVLTGSSFIVIDNAAKLVIENPSPNAITNSGTAGIMTEAEFDQIYWMTGASTGTYVVPFVSELPYTQIPFTVAINTAGSSDGRLILSTYPGSVFDNDTYKPSDVTHMFDYNTNSINNSAHVIDRFWIADANTYTSKPSATFDFTYRDLEVLQSGNVIIESALGAQRFNSGTSQWGDYLPQGITNIATNVTSGVPVIPADFFRSWTLSEVTNPLPVDIVYFKSACSNEQIELSWQTLSETHIDHFEIEYLNENGIFVAEGFVMAAGGGSGVQNYAYYPQHIRSGTFRLVELNSDGVRTVKSSVNAECEAGDFTASYNNEDNSLTIYFQGQYKSVEPLFLYDAAGRMIFSTELAISKGTNAITIPGVYLSSGIYITGFKNGNKLMSGKFLAN